MQEIASHGCFSLGMVARFESTLHEKNTWMYPRLFWETGVLGQVLYLEAHAVGISATGIGCYFDDPGKLLFLTVILAEVFPIWLQLFIVIENSCQNFMQKTDKCYTFRPSYTKT